MNRALPLCLLLAGPALAQPAASPLRLTLTQARIVSTVDANGKSAERQEVSPAGVQPGDVLAQLLSASNVSGAALRRAALTLPVPAGTVYQGGATPGSARWSVLYSADGGKTFASAPLTRTVTVTENGVAVRKQLVIPPSEYTAVRWVVGALAPGETLKFSFRVKVK